MSFLDKFFNRSPLITPTYGGFNGGFSSLFGANGAVITPDNANNITTVFTCNKIIGETLTTFKVRVLEREEKNGKHITKRTKHGLNTLLSFKPNPIMSANTWLKMVVADLNFRGTHYSQIQRDGFGDIVAIYPLYHDNMTVELKENGTILYKYTTSTRQVTLRQNEVLKIISIPNVDGLTGISPIEANKRLLEFSVNSDDYGSRFYKNGANPSGIFYKDGILEDKAYERLKESLTKSYSGVVNVGKPMILESGLKYQQMSLTNADAQYLETKKFQKSEIASIFRVPMHLVNSMENATFSNIEQQSLEFIKYTMLPWVRNISQQLVVQLFSPDEWEKYEIDFNINTLLKGDYKTRTDGYSTMIQNGVMSINEVRELENLNSIDGGDKHFMQLNMTTIDKAGQNEDTN